MNKQIISLYSKKMSVIALLLCVHNASADFGFDDALEEMMHAVEKIQNKFNKVQSSMHKGMQNFMHNTFSSGPLLNITKNDAYVVLTTHINDLDKDSIKAIVHNDILTITAQNKETEMELIVDQKNDTAKIIMQHHVEVKDEQSDKNGDKKSINTSYSSQQMMQSLPEKITLNDVAVEYEKGIVTVRLPRIEPVVSPKAVAVIKK